MTRLLSVYSLPSAGSSGEQPGGVRLNPSEAPALYTALFLARLYLTNMSSWLARLVQSEGKDG